MSGDSTHGVVEAVSSKVSPSGKPTYSIKLNGAWYSSFGTCPVKKGDTVDMEYVLNGEYKNISKITPVSAEKKDLGVDENARLRRITDIILKSCDMVIAGKITLNEVAPASKNLLNLLHDLSKPEKPEIPMPPEEAKK